MKTLLLLIKVCDRNVLEVIILEDDPIFAKLICQEKYYIHLNLRNIISNYFRVFLSTLLKKFEGKVLWNSEMLGFVPVYKILIIKITH